MDDKTLTALTELAHKLGTTAEYLWGVLLKQAPISGAINLVVMVGWVAAFVWWFQLVQRKTTKPTESDENQYTRAQWRDECAGFAWGSVVVLGAITVLCIGSSLSSTAAAFFNPEYWALKNLLSAMK